MAKKAKKVSRVVKKKFSPGLLYLILSLVVLILIAFFVNNSKISKEPQARNNCSLFTVTKKNIDSCPKSDCKTIGSGKLKRCIYVTSTPRRSPTSTTKRKAALKVQAIPARKKTPVELCQDKYKNLGSPSNGFVTVKSDFSCPSGRMSWGTVWYWSLNYAGNMLCCVVPDDFRILGDKDCAIHPVVDKNGNAIGRFAERCKTNDSKGCDKASVTDQGNIYSRGSVYWATNIISSCQTVLRDSTKIESGTCCMTP